MVDKNRRLLLCSLALLAEVPHAYAGTASFINDVNWRVECRRWMHVLIPEDETGPGADTPDVWRALDTLLTNIRFKKSFFSGLSGLKNLQISTEEKELSSFMGSDTAHAKFINAFFVILIEAYYGAEVGWKTLGLSDPPQPIAYVNKMIIE